MTKDLKKGPTIDVVNAQASASATIQEITDALKKAKVITKPLKDVHVKLSPRFPFVSGKGSLTFLGNWEVDSGSDFARSPWSSEQTENGAVLSVHVIGLEPFTTYGLAIRVKAFPADGAVPQFDLTWFTTSEDGGAAGAATVAAGGEQTLLVALVTARGDMGSVSICQTGLKWWEFRNAVLYTPLLVKPD